jgi:hypothetical protein
MEDDEVDPPRPLTGRCHAIRHAGVSGDPAEIPGEPARFPLDELAKYFGQWVAWSPDGTRVVASSTDPDALEDLVRAAGEDPMFCVVEGIPEHDSLIGGGLEPEGS